MDGELAGLVGNLIETYEGYRSRPYQDPGGTWTIGFGTTVLPTGNRVTADTPPVMVQEARQWYQAAADAIDRQIMAEAPVALTVGQRAALIDFAYNLGITRLLGDGEADSNPSTLWKKLSAGDMAAASAEFPRWCYAAGRKLDGLLRRREAERALFDRGY